MKKFYFLLVAMMVSIAANAQWYIVGANFGWSDAAANELKATDNPDEYSITVKSLSGTIKIKEKGTWSTSFGSNGAKLVEGVKYSASKDGGDITVDGTISNATITINTADYTIIAKGEAAENEYSEVYLVGDFDGKWNESITSYPLTSTNGTTFTGKYTLTAATSYFKMKAGSLVYGTGGLDIAVVLGESYTASQSGNAFSIGAGEYTFTFELQKNADTGVLTVTGEGDEPIITPDNKSYKLNSQITGNELWEAVALEKNAEGNWEYTGSFVAGEFGIQVFEGTENIGWIGGAAEVTEADKAYPFGEGANSSSTLEGTYTFVYNPTAGTVTFVPFQGEITVVKTYALRGNIVTGEWDDYALTEKNGAWEVELNVVPGDFGIKYMENGAQKGWFSAPTAADAAVEATGTFQAAGIGGTNWSSTLEGLYTFSFNPETEVLTISKTTTGIESIEVEEGVEAVYYNLQGVRVANPENGLYIRVAGKTASKVFIR